MASSNTKQFGAGSFAEFPRAHKNAGNWHEPSSMSIRLRKFPTIDEEYETDPVNLNDSCDGLIKAFDQLSSLSRNEADCAPSNDAEHTPEVTNFKHTWVLDDCSQYDFSQPAKVKHTWSQPNAPNCKSDEPDEVIDLVNWLHSSNFREIEATANGDPVAMAKLDAEIKKNPTSQPKASL